RVAEGRRERRVDPAPVVGAPAPAAVHVEVGEREPADRLAAEELQVERRLRPEAGREHVRRGGREDGVARGRGRARPDVDVERTEGRAAHNESIPLTSARHVTGPTTPSTVIPRASWKPRTAASVFGPKIPSISRPFPGSPERLRNWNSSWTPRTPSPVLP